MKITSSTLANVVIAVMAVLCNVFAYPIGGGNWIIGIPLPYVVFEPAAGDGGLLDFSSPISPILFLVDVAGCFVVISFFKWLLFRRRSILDMKNAP